MKLAIICRPYAFHGGIETYRSPRRPGDKVHIRPGMWGQYMQERHFGVMQGRFLKGIAQGLPSWLRKVCGDKYMGEGHDHSSLMTRAQR